MSKLAFVTGGKGGIGTAIARALYNAGHKVIVSEYRQNKDTKEWLEQQRHDGYEFDVVQVDVSNFDSCVICAQEIEKKYGIIDILVNNAGITQDSQFKKMTVAQWRDVVSTNLDSVFNVTRQFINPMLEQQWGRIINISSINGQKGQFGQTNYSAAKAGLHGFTMALAQECASKGVTVNTISPGYTATPMVTAIREDILDNIIKQVPVGRLAYPEEIGALTTYLTSDHAAFITGANLPINGGQFTSF